MVETFINDIIKKENKYLDEIYEHTEYKIKYVTKYVENWLYVSANNSKVKNINFIDCMCNAGVYKNGTWGTPIEVLKLFISFAPNHPKKNFNLFLNDYDKDRIRIIKIILAEMNYIKYPNINIFIDNEDVNSYIFKQKNNKRYFATLNYSERPATILFVDPYCFGEIKIKVIADFLHTNYSELIFNYFNSDYRRNVQNISTPQKMKKIDDCMEGILGYNSKMNETQLMRLIYEVLKVKNIKYCFSYPFRIKTNVELYHIIFSTPNSAGLKKIKDSLWEIFKGDCFFKNGSYNEQLSLWNDEDIRCMNAQNFAKEAQNIIVEKFNGKLISYDEISNFVLENTMLKDAHIIKYLLIPLIEQGKISKTNSHGKTNYKEDTFSFII